jgi:ribose transport system permease protein
MVSNMYEHRALQLILRNSAVISLLIIILLAALTNEHFLTWINIKNVLRQTSVICILALGVHFVILQGKIDLSVGAVLAASGTTILASQTYLNFSITASIIFGLIIALCLGLINGLLVAFGRISSFIVTIGMMFMIRSFIMWFATGGAIVGSHPDYSFIGNGYILGIPFIVIPMIAAIIVAYLILNYSLLGRYLQAIGQNPLAASLSGVPIKWVTISAFGISGLAAGVGAVLETSRLNSITTYWSGITYELDVIAAIVIGGTSLQGGKGTIIGTVAGVFILSIISNYMNLINISTYLQGVLKGLLIIVILLRQNRYTRV